MRVFTGLILFIILNTACRQPDRPPKIIEFNQSAVASTSEAFQYINERIEKDPDNAELYYKKANLAIKMKEWETAEEAVQRYADIHSTTDDILLLKARIDYNLGNLHEAIQIAETLFIKGYKELELNELLFELYFENKEYLKSLDQINLALEKKSGDARYHYMRAKNYLYINDTSAALVNMQTAFNNGFQSAPALIEYIDLLNKAGKGRLAFETVDKAIRRYPESVGIQLIYIKMLMDQNELFKAEKRLYKIIERHESLSEAYTLLGEIKQAEHRYDSTIYYTEKAIAENSDYLPAYYLKARACRAKGQYYTSLNIYREILDSIPNDQIALKESEKLRNYLSYLQNRKEEEEEQEQEPENRQTLPELEKKPIQN